jgi:hypothetical protein
VRTRASFALALGVTLVASAYAGMMVAIALVGVGSTWL